MTTPNAERRYVAAPAWEPVPFGILSVARLVPDASLEDHWEAGIVWESVVKCGPAEIAEAQCEPVPEPKTIGRGVSAPEGDPFVVYATFGCSPVGHWGDALDRAAANLLAGEERALARAIYLGEAGNLPALVNAATVDATPVPGTAVPLADGVALLEAYLRATHPSLGVIHGNPREVSLMSGAHLLREPNAGATSLTTFLGTYVSADGGFTGNVGPDGTVVTDGSGEHWLYASARPVVRRSEVIRTPPNKQQALKTATNDLEAIAERVYVVSWDCVPAAVLVDTIATEGA